MILDSSSAYIESTSIFQGVEFLYIPDVGDKPLVADMSSTILSRPIDVSSYGVIYAGAQKNVGPAGLTIVIVREDLIGQVIPGTPVMFNYKTHSDADSMYNTPPTYSWYMAGLVFQWIKRLGGLDAMAKINERKASMLYDAIDNSGIFSNPVAVESRSWMNVPFVTGDKSLDNLFIQMAKNDGLVNLEGHRSVGGMRASIYNAMPEEGVYGLISFMEEFERRYGGERGGR